MYYVLTSVYSLNSADLSFMIRTLQCQCTADFVFILYCNWREERETPPAGDCRPAAADVSSGLEAGGCWSPAAVWRPHCS